MKVGSVLGCHQLGSRSFFLFGYQFPVCARCTGIYFGFFVAFLFCLPVSKVVIVAMLIPMIVDGTIQLSTRYQSNNGKRFLTGTLFGVGVQELLARGIAWLIFQM